MIVQIYEVSHPSEARRLVGLGVDHIGVLVGQGDFPRELAPEKAREIFRSVPEKARKVALCLSHDPSTIADIVRESEPDVLHLGAAPELLSPRDALQIREHFSETRIMRAIPVMGEKSIETARAYEGIADFLLLDTYRPGDVQVGATGQTHDWKISRRIVEAVETPVILAGGLGPENVADAIRAVRPAGVDSKTKTDTTDGRAKDLDKVRAFVRRAKASSLR